ncbi:MAG: membrane protein oxaA [Candidatus Xenolissoclinum pacificiensis L6]|uniref:Membrane protein insertase YidC n=1 Tax=Candidatus Xenolissoclinum pacificiensis L6 TaxID=1401685 RepID=W2V031_9RICK|nr:MAG: membrane protein oxaA [Candidatus Xenolissoclinum pacificiensis L6]
MNESRNVFVALFVSIFIITAWNFFFFDKKDVSYKESTGHGSVADISEVVYEVAQDRNTIINDYKDRVIFENSNIMGSINLRGLRIDDLMLKNYYQTVEKESNVFLLNPLNSEKYYFAEFGWLAKGGIKVPNKDTVWKASLDSIGANDTVMISWDNGEGLTFHLDISIDDKYMFSVSQYVENHTDTDISLANYGRIDRKIDKITSNFIFHEGVTGFFANKLSEISYKKIFKKNHVFRLNDSGERKWFSLEDKYWFTSMVLSGNVDRVNLKTIDRDQIQGNFISNMLTVSANRLGSYQKTLFFAGVKELYILDDYKNSENIPMFDKNLDFGFFYFITKPMFLLLNMLNGLIGNFGVSIIVFVFLVKLLLFPITKKSSVSMIKIQKLQPTLKNLRQKYANNRVKLNQEILAVFRENNVNPASGILPIILQIPIFFSLYKVLMITIQMRQTPFFLWIKDLSEPDPTTVLNLFGLIDWEPSISFGIGLFPILLGLTMIIQQRVSQGSLSSSLDNNSLYIMKFMPIIFVFVSAHFPSGLILYWICSNIISVCQQVYIKRTVK